MDDLSRLLGHAALLTVCVVVLTGFLLLVAFGLARLTVHYLDHVDHEIRKDQTSGSVVHHTGWSAQQLNWNVSDVSPDYRQLAQLQLSSPSG